MSIRQGNNIIAGNTDGKKFNAYMTNCITEIPQDIKLETNTTFIIVKAGSKVYIPNGFEQDGTTPHFDTFTIPEDMSIGFMEGVSTRVILYDVTNEYINAEDLSLCSSGNTPPSSDGTWYDISTNRIKRYLNGSQDSVGFSLPLGIVKTDLIGRTSIDKEFNGFGYIGSTVFVLPGVKGLIPNGRNPDGTLKNIEHTTNKVSIRTISNANPYTELTIANTGSSGIGINNHYLNEKENYLYYSDGTKLNDRFVIGKISFSQTSPFNVTSFNTNTTFHALDYNDKPTISGWGIPDYSSPTYYYTGEFTATNDGYIICYAHVGEWGKLEIFSNGNLVDATHNNTSGTSILVYARGYVGKGELIEVTGAASDLNIIFYPLKGSK